jgi:hypothetical protein
VGKVLKEVFAGLIKFYKSQRTDGQEQNAEKGAAKRSKYLWLEEWLSMCDKCGFMNSYTF